jgi:hypothetical protein
MRGDGPEVITRIVTKPMRDFIDLCLMRPERRLSAHELLEHPFLAFRQVCVTDAHFS